MSEIKLTLIDNSYVVAEPGVELVHDENTVLRAIEKAFVTRKMLLHQSNVNPDFFDLSSGLAGVFLQKIAQYQIKTAFVVDRQSIKSERFQELINETNSNDDYRFFATQEEAAQWLRLT